MEKKRYFRFFTIADFEQEQEWLNSMSRSGWNFVHTNGFVYTFEKGTPGEYIYKIDLPRENMTDAEVALYYDFMKECGVEVVAQFKMWRYLRQKANSQDFKVANDTLSQLVMVNKAYAHATHLLGIIIVLVAVIMLVGSVVISLSAPMSRVAQFLEGLITGLSTSSIIALALIFVPIVGRLRRRMNQLVEKLQIENER